MEKTIKADCPTCKGTRNSDVFGEFEERKDDGNDGTWAEIEYRILKCRGCETVFFQKQTTFSEHIEEYQDALTGERRRRYNSKFEYWPPKLLRTAPSWVFDELFWEDPHLESLFGEMYSAVTSNANVLACIGIRTIFDYASKKLGVDENLSFSDKLEKLLENGKISADEKKLLELTINAGNAAAHRGWKPKSSELNKLIDILESFTQRTFLLGIGVHDLEKKIPQKQKKAKKQ